MKVIILKYSSYFLMIASASVSEIVPSFMNITEVLNEIQVIVLTWVTIGIGVTVMMMNISTTRKNNSERAANERRDTVTTMKDEISKQMKDIFKNIGNGTSGKP